MLGNPDGATPQFRTRVLLRERNGVLLPADHPLAREYRRKLAAALY